MGNGAAWSRETSLRGGETRFAVAASCGRHEFRLLPHIARGERRPSLLKGTSPIFLLAPVYSYLQIRTKTLSHTSDTIGHYTLGLGLSTSN